ncbi:MAG: carboxypeptidase-like regulatory domain-containing protein [Longimicrobiales bacterium]|nr:carboxypeptidase-like regulatory domain-containing protein [Longimicrobiales bacterium]
MFGAVLSLALWLTLFPAFPPETALARPLAAQQAAPATVLGRVSDRDTGTPLVGAFVTLLDGEGVRRAGVLTDEAGRYVMRAPAPGRYRLRASRIGVESAFSVFFEVAAGGVVNRDLQTTAAAVTLAGLEVTGETRRCRIAGDQASATVGIWEEARKALEVAEWVDEGGYLYDIRVFRRRYDPGGARVVRETTRRESRAGRVAFRALETDRLLEDGFVQPEGDGFVYYAPDAGVLLDDAFLDTHCFRAVRDGDRVGLDFEPVGRRDVPDIAGTLWLTGDGALERVEYRYTGLPEPARSAPGIGGEIHFRRMEEGAWIVSRWHVRMPVVGQVFSPGGTLLRTEVAGVDEEGAEVTRARRTERIVLRGEDRFGTVRGRALGADDVPVVGARVFLSGTAHEVRTAADGTFRIEGVGPGVYRAVLDHPRLDSLGLPPQEHTLAVEADSVTGLNVRLLEPIDVIDGRCTEGGGWRVLTGSTEADRGRSADLGGSVLDGSGAPLAGWPVRVRWARYWISQGGTGAVATERQRDGAVVSTDAHGGWAICGVPADHPVEVSVAVRPLTDEELARGGDVNWERPLEIPHGSLERRHWLTLRGGR